MTAGSLSIHATLTSPLSLRLGTSLCVLACAQVLFLVVRDSSTLTCNFDLSPGRYWRPSPCLASTCTQVCSLGYVCAVQLPYLLAALARHHATFILSIAARRR